VKSFPKPICDNNLIRTRHTETQTRKSREERLDNMQGVFALRNPKELANKHILLVDDVITTGATTEACWSALKNIEGIKISLASLAVSGDT
jgi:predicted amidophosphoribosyltransferase